jgi:hypothetical protein
MRETDFWDRVKHGCEKLNVPVGTYNVWKHRGRVSRDQQIALYQVLEGTEFEIPLDQISKVHKIQ